VVAVAVDDKHTLFHKVLAAQVAVVMVDLQLEAMAQMELPTQVVAVAELAVKLTVP
jgi:hypothetical protein